MTTAEQDNSQADRGPIYRALWHDHDAIRQSLAPEDDAPEHVQRVMDASLAVLRRHREAKSLRGADGKHSEPVLRELGTAGYWGLLVRRDLGGSGCALRHMLPFLTRAAIIDAPLAGLAAVHGCIGAVDPLQTFGTPEQQARWLPKLASGERLSAFASTEPGAGSDLTGIQMTAIRDGNMLRLSGQKAFITNLAPSRTIGMLCKLEDKPAVVIVDLPNQESEQFQLVPNPLHPLKHTINQGVRLRDFEVPLSNLLQPPAGKDGRAIVFHGLNRGRAALCALAAGHLRVVLSGMLAWAKERTIRGEPLASLELIQARIGRIAALISGCDILARWCGQLLDAGYRGELECITAKVFASEALKTAVVDLALPTHGGRFFLQGHPAGDMVYDYLAPCIYEGENELLCLAMFHAMSKGCGQHPDLQTHSSEWGHVGWHFERGFIEQATNAGQSLLPTQQIHEVRTMHSLVVLGLLEPPRAGKPTITDRAQDVLKCRMARQSGYLDRKTFHYELQEEVELGRAILGNPPADLADAPPFINPLPIT